MANKFTQIQSTPYVPTYQPIDFNQMGSLMKDASAYQASMADSDARSEALLSSVAPSDPEGQQFIEEITRRQKENLASRQGEPLAQQAIRAKTAGTKTAGAIQAYQNAKQQVSDWESNVLEANKDIADQDELAFRMAQQRPQIQYDPENLNVSVNGTREFRLAPDVNYADKADEFLKGSKDRVSGIERRINPATGKEEIVTTKGMTPERAQSILDRAFASDPEVQAFRSRRADYYSQLAEQQGPEESVQNLLSSVDADTRSELRERINRQQETMPLSQVVGNIMADSEIRDAQGFGSDKYAYREFDRQITSPLSQKGNISNRLEASGFGLTEMLNNPQLKDSQKEMSFTSVLPSEYLGGKGLRTPIIGAGISQPYYNEDQAPDKDVNQANIEDIVSSDKVKENYGNTLKQVHDSIGGKPEDMNNREYLETVLKPAYDKKMNALSSMRKTVLTSEDPELNQEIADLVIGDKAPTGQWGMINKTSVSNVTPGMETSDLALSDLADEFGVDLSSPEGRKTLQERMSIIGKASDNSSYFVRAYNENGWLGTDNQEMILEVDNFNKTDQSRGANAQKLFDLQSSPTKNSTKINVGGTQVEAKARDAYIDPETGMNLSPSDPKSMYKKRLEFSWEEDGQTITVDEEDERFDSMLRKINQLD